MKKNLTIWQLILNSLQSNIPVMLLYVLESKGSSPGRQGFFMAVNRKGEMEGSIGGGIMEHKFVEMAKQKLADERTNQEAPGIKKQFHNKAASTNQSGMICSGEQTNLLYQLKKEDVYTVENLIDSLANEDKGILELSPSGLFFHQQNTINGRFQYEFQSEEDWLYRETIGFQNTIHTIGGGHCSLAFSEIMAMMDFLIHVYDTRPGLNTMTENKHAKEKLVITDYSELKDLIAGGPNEFVVIMTFGYRTDEIALRALLSKQFRYLGLLGSSNKIKKLLSDLKKEGFSPEQIDKIHAPVGLPINSQTPEEIAISIAAEIIQIKNRV